MKYVRHRKTNTTGSHLCNLKNVESKNDEVIEVERRMVVTRDWRWGRRGKGQRVQIFN